MTSHLSRQPRGQIHLAELMSVKLLSIVTLITHWDQTHYTYRPTSQLITRRTQPIDWHVRFLSYVNDV